MTNDDIIKLAHEAGFSGSVARMWPEYFKAFANLIAAHKAEVITAEAYRCGYKDGIKAAAVICESVDKSTHPADLAAAIRARGNT